MVLHAEKYVHLCMSAYRDWWIRTALLGFTVSRFGIMGNLSQNSEESHSCQHLSAVSPLMSRAMWWTFSLVYYITVKQV